MNEHRNRGVEDILLAVVGGLKGFSEAIAAIFPDALVQTCIVHPMRHSLDFVSCKDRRLVTTTNTSRSGAEVRHAPPSPRVTTAASAALPKAPPEQPRQGRAGGLGRGARARAGQMRGQRATSPRLARRDVAAPRRRGRRRTVPARSQPSGSRTSAPVVRLASRSACAVRTSESA